MSTVGIHHVVAATSQVYGVPIDDLLGVSRSRSISWPRQLAMVVSRKVTGLSLPMIGDRFGGRDHTTVLHAVRAMPKRLRQHPDIRHEMDMVTKRAHQLAGCAMFQARYSNPPVFKSTRRQEGA